MTKEELEDKHIASALGYKKGPTDYQFNVTGRLIAKKATDISIEYAISELEYIQTWWTMGSENYSRLEKKIIELKSLIK